MADVAYLIQTLQRCGQAWSAEETRSASALAQERCEAHPGGSSLRGLERSGFETQPRLDFAGVGRGTVRLPERQQAPQLHPPNQLAPLVILLSCRAIFSFSSSAPPAGGTKRYDPTSDETARQRKNSTPVCLYPHRPPPAVRSMPAAGKQGDATNYSYSGYHRPPYKSQPQAHVTVCAAPSYSLSPHSDGGSEILMGRMPLQERRLVYFPDPGDPSGAFALGLWNSSRPASVW